MKYWLDGVALTDPQNRWFPDRRTGIRIVPAKRKGGISFPHTDGEQFIANQSFDPSKIKVSLDVWGETHEEFMKNYEFIVGLMSQRHKLMEFRHKYNVNDATKDRIAFVECIDIREPKLLAKNNATVEAIFSVPGVFWRGPSLLTVSNAMTAVKTSKELGLFQGGNAPINDALIQFKGAFSTAEITDDASGSSLRITGALTASEYLVVDPVRWIARKHAADSWSLTTGTIADILAVPSQGYGTMFGMAPSVDAAALTMRYRVTVSGTNVSGTPAVSFRAKPSYL